MIVEAVQSDELGPDDAKMFALEFAALLDGLSIQVALEDPEVDSDVATRLRCGSPSENSICPMA